MTTQTLQSDSSSVVATIETFAAQPVRGGVLVFATKGRGHGDEKRILDLVSGIKSETFTFDPRAKVRSAWRLLMTLFHQRPQLVVMEGTSFGGGVPLILGRLLAGVPFVVSSGDAVGPFLSAVIPVLTPAFAIYERMLCRSSAGFIGWSPYLVGRALSFGAPRAMTAPGWGGCHRDDSQRAAARERIRGALGIGPDEIVFGIAGTLEWSSRFGYCYGYELVRAVTQARREGLRVLIVGDGTGRKHLEHLAGDALGKIVLMPGRVPRDQVADYLAAMDVGSLPQSVDGVGSFRYTIKLSEYIGASLPIVIGQIPLAYDLDDGWLWRLPGKRPWDDRYIAAVSKLMRRITLKDIGEKRAAVPRNPAIFSRELQIKRVTRFLEELLAREDAA